MLQWCVYQLQCIGVVVVQWLSLLHNFIHQSLNFFHQKLARGMLEIRDGEDLWQWSQLEIRLRLSSVNHTTKTIHIIFITIRLSNHVTKVLKSWHRFKSVFTNMYLGGIQTVSWGTFTFTFLGSKHVFFLQFSFNSRASFMYPEVAGLAKYWVYTNSFGTHHRAVQHFFLAFEPHPTNQVS